MPERAALRSEAQASARGPACLPHAQRERPPGSTPGAWREPGQGADSLLCEVGCAAGLPQVDPASPFNELALAQHEECGALLARSASVWLAVVAALVLMA